MWLCVRWLGTRAASGACWAFFYGMLASPAQAYQLGAHAWITERAVAEFNLCHKGLFGEIGKIVNGDDARTLVWTNQEEDLNLFRKWLEYSHYYNPHKKLDLVRKDSGDRMVDLEQSLASDIANGDRHTFTILAHLGHVLHHLQDMTSPPHVVPVAHDLSDGFERLEIDGQPVTLVAAPSEMNCSTQKALIAGSAGAPGIQTPLTLLNRTAEATLTALRGGGVSNSVGRIDENLFWAAPAMVQPRLTFDAFQLPNEMSAFGSYGAYGNHFGETEFIDEGGVRQTISRQVYLGIWARQLRQAIDASRLAIEIFWQRRAL